MLEEVDSRNNWHSDILYLSNPFATGSNDTRSFYVGWLFGFYGISTFVGYLMPNPFLYK